MRPTLPPSDQVAAFLRLAKLEPVLTYVVRDSQYEPTEYFVVCDVGLFVGRVTRNEHGNHILSGDLIPWDAVGPVILAVATYATVIWPRPAVPPDRAARRIRRQSAPPDENSTIYAERTEPRSRRGSGEHCRESRHGSHR